MSTVIILKSSESLSEALAVVEKELVLSALHEAHNRLPQTAKQLGIDTETLSAKLRTYGFYRVSPTNED